MKKSIFAAALAATLALTGMARADDFPNRTITMIIPFAAGGPTDVLGRIMAQGMGEALGQTIIVENIGGAGGMTGGKRVADSKPDGYTILLGTVGTQAQGQTLYKKPLYNAVTDFTSLTPRRMRARCSSVRPAPARPRISAASCSTPRWASTSPTCLTKGRVRRCRTSWAAASTTSARSSRPPSRRSTARP
jgi:hypothetical protein